MSVTQEFLKHRLCERGSICAQLILVISYRLLMLNSVPRNARGMKEDTGSFPTKMHATRGKLLFWGLYTGF